MPEMFAGLPVRGQTTAWAFSALGVIAIASALFGMAGGVAHAGGGAAV
jgi:hypothetical protein